MTGKQMTYQYTEIAAELENRYPRFAPWRYIKEEEMPIAASNGTQNEQHCGKKE